MAAITRTPQPAVAHQNRGSQLLLEGSDEPLHTEVIRTTDVISLLAAAGAAAALITMWAIVIAPKAANGLSQPQKDVIGTVVLLVAGAALGLSGQLVLAVTHGAVVLLNAVLLFIFRREATSWLEG